MWREFWITLLFLPLALLAKMADISDRKYLASLSPKEREQEIWRRK
jgi:hypothetical protein